MSTNKEKTMTNQTAMQYFEWYLPSDGQHWNNLAEDAQHLADLWHQPMFWMPPAFQKLLTKMMLVTESMTSLTLGNSTKKEPYAPIWSQGRIP